MDKALLKKITEAFGTKPLSGSAATYAKVLLHPDNSIAVYYVNADSISHELKKRGYAWNPQLHVWEKRVSSIEHARRETDGYPATAAALSQIH